MCKSEHKNDSLELLTKDLFFMQMKRSKKSDIDGKNEIKKMVIQTHWRWEFHGKGTKQKVKKINFRIECNLSLIDSSIFLYFSFQECLKRVSMDSIFNWNGKTNYP